MKAQDVLKLVADSNNFRHLSITEALQYPAASDSAYIADIVVDDKTYVIIADGDELKITDESLNEYTYFLQKI